MNFATHKALGWLYKCTGEDKCTIYKTQGDNINNGSNTMNGSIDYSTNISTLSEQAEHRE